MVRPAPIAAISTLAAAVFGCAIGFRDAPETLGAGGETTFATTGSSSSGGGMSGSSRSASSSSTSTSVSSTSTGGAGGGSDGGSGGGCNYDAPDTCSTAEDLMVIFGDTAGPTLSENGSTSAWFNVEVYENSHGAPVSLSYEASLTNSAGALFALFAYESAPGDLTTSPCTATAMACTGEPCSVGDTWSDRFNTDDSRNVTLEVRYISGGLCGNAAQWTLNIAGNQ